MVSSPYLSSLRPWSGEREFSLEPLRSVLNELGNPQNTFKIVHVAGTNGKGSVSTFISSILGQSGATVGMNISPHLIRINERFVIDGIAVEDREIEENALSVERASKKANVLLSFHEALTAIAFLIFKSRQVDYVVLEVGLGGRLDASNVISHSEVAVIVSIGFDHQDVLGSSIQEIASEKAGIIKPNGTVVVGDMAPEALSAISRVAKFQHASLHALHSEFHSKSLDKEESVILSADKEVKINPQLRGAHQIHNAAVAAKVCDLLNVPCSDIRNGIENAFWPARLERTSFRDRDYLLDCAHNEPGIEVLCNYLNSQEIKKVPIVIGALKTKNWKPMLTKLVSVAKEFYFLRPETEMAVDTAELSKFLSGSGINGYDFGCNYQELIDFLSKSNHDELTVVTGSIYMVGKLRSLLDIPERPLWLKK